MNIATRRILFAMLLLAVPASCLCTQVQSGSAALATPPPPDNAPAARAAGVFPSTVISASRFHVNGDAHFHMTGDVRRLAFMMVHDFPFVSAEVNGTKGKMMFDTGAQQALNLNDHLLTNLGPGRAAGSGFVGSGQSYTVTLRSRVDQVTIGSREDALSFAGVSDVPSQDLSFLEPLTPDCLGLVGYDSFDGYLMKLDYAKGVLTFYKATDKRRVSRDFLKGETVLAVLPFETRKLPNHPLIHLKVGDEEFLGAFDTGQIGMVQMSKETQQALADQKLLTPLPQSQISNGSQEHGATMYTIKGLHLSAALTASISGVPVSNQPGPAAGPMGTPETNIISLGYSFLSQYKTVWDYPDKKIYLLRK